MNHVNGATYSKEAKVLASRAAQQLRDDWQCRLLVEAKGKNAAIVLAMLANLYYEALEVMLRVCFPTFERIEPPLFTGFARILQDGRVVCDYMSSKYAVQVNALVYETEAELIKEFRDIADRLKFSDADRKAMFADLKRWVSRDDRIKPEADA